MLKTRGSRQKNCCLLPARVTDPSYRHGGSMEEVRLVPFALRHLSYQLFSFYYFLSPADDTDLNVKGTARTANSNPRLRFP